ncbi:MAG: GNAT family N-acetyltransferase, partial [Verrucomicrobiae bacterium]|nr:GNAT family N-acetyltransferase [Verrucomicrobiae bacterium]
MIQIRPYTRNDWEGICKVHDQSRPLEFEETSQSRQFTPLMEDPEGSALQQCRLLVACEDDQVIGFTGSHEDYLGWLYLDPAYRGQGIARKLLKECLKYTGPHTWTVAMAENKTAIRLYE